MCEQAQGAGARANTGGNAFPSPDWNGDWKGPEASHGMTLRDHFAGQALPALIENADLSILDKIAKVRSVSIMQVFGIIACEYADAMIAARGH
ncbi:hypothetical protein [Ochrobactrum sp. Marseille-Q0166]|uniref:hypothetical protein n=1 Tax=Ochrobactrum sp. Marseille-Q0166 TaxID=2761105 RepID=UPI0016550D11|nr:hypothetical protein [Ochrobactrum sp. Marseille-Q0166]MBC8719327.1 hypothetical protein [Ochrobactrum sp. Marseille-Q0166]